MWAEGEHPGPVPHTSQLPTLQIPAQDPLSQSQPLRIKDKSHTCFRNSDHKTGGLEGPRGEGGNHQAECSFMPGASTLSGGSSSSSLWLRPCRPAWAPPLSPLQPGITGAALWNILQPEPFAHPLLLPRWSLPLSLIPTCPGGPDKGDCPVPARKSSSTATTSLEQDARGPLVSRARGPGEEQAVPGPVEHRAQLCRTNQRTPNRPSVSLTQLNLELLLFLSFCKGIFNTITSPSSICTHIQSTVTFKTSPQRLPWS